LLEKKVTEKKTLGRHETGPQSKTHEKTGWEEPGRGQQRNKRESIELEPDGKKNLSGAIVKPTEYFGKKLEVGKRLDPAISGEKKQKRWLLGVIAMPGEKPLRGRFW